MNQLAYLIGQTRTQRYKHMRRETHLSLATWTRHHTQYTPRDESSSAIVSSAEGKTTERFSV
jgi:hypothetical protein